jgi:pyruvate dehydrogenase E1 component beta subunit
MAAARAALSRVAPAIANVRARPSLALKRGAFARGYATASENSVRVPRHSHASSQF